MTPVPLHRTYHSYLLRIWREDDDLPWRASLQSVATEQTFRFPHVDALFAFLLGQMESEAAQAKRSAQQDDDDKQQPLAISK